MDPTEADLFFVPTYSTCYLHSRSTNFILAYDMLQRSVQHVRQNYPYWDKSNGKDHVFVLSHDLGGCMAPLAVTRNSIILTHYGDVADREVSIHLLLHCFGS